MKFHLNVAQEGMRAGHKFISKLGLKWLSVEIEVVPPSSSGGGGFIPLDPVYIKVTVTFKDKSWSVVREKSYFSALGFVVVTSAFNGYQIIKANVQASLSKATKVVKDILIRVI